MDLRQLRYFVKVVECGNVTRASEALHIAQPAISQQMRNLERDLGMQLLERSVQGVAPTAAGQTLYRHAIELLRQADSTRELLRQDAELPQGRVSVAMPSSTARMMAIPLARTIRDRYPGIALELLEAPSAELGSLIGSGRVDLAVVVDAVETRGVAAQRLLTEALYLIAWPEFQMPREPVSIAELARMPLILPSAPNTIRSRVEWALREAGLPCEILFEASSTALLFAAVMAKLGVTILPWTAAHVELDEHKLKLAKVDHRLFSRDLSLCWHDTALLSNAVQKVKATILELFDSMGKRPEWAAAD
ncbi:MULTISPECIES: LysR substrate-binding domain-containing protein [Paraburkholderia]|uniref:HTH-type transcriptional regulator ArgP n=2 Tax=Paraburkholderia TaxID=1822464 RepID=A0ABN7KG92_9BURK|nr:MULTISPECIES: LysR substrate-binding domain-containing protein [Paraburkholderia]KPD19260.1 LysR family transcriptional regulator [Burkholderia sp. ST111]MBK5147167.1 LysR family transcriptional regulator [Burkholderia sp. R-69608]MBK3738565.1 LysR family transcriptional regulator [Paraburkholderia aspalathi]MBK3778943.1 LysR family transcriptional regulator [Paraburkholderia aspalathi]MBK3809458.1 LysR family transcriptional regulator [Paraburkholderia aspalathi]